jgi:hypothetical protein
MVARGTDAFALRAGKLLRWSFGGYGEWLGPTDLKQPVLLTPATSIAALRAGFRPAWHPSAS